MAPNQAQGCPPDSSPGPEAAGSCQGSPKLVPSASTSAHPLFLCLEHPSMFLPLTLGLPAGHSCPSVPCSLCLLTALTWRPNRRRGVPTTPGGTGGAEQIPPGIRWVQSSTSTDGLSGPSLLSFSQVNDPSVGGMQMTIGRVRQAYFYYKRIKNPPPPKTTTHIFSLFLSLEKDPQL